MSERLGGPADMAAEAVRLADSDPARARAIASAALAAALAEGDSSTASMARRALGFAATEAGDLPGAVAHLRAAAETADRAGLRVRAAEARRSLTRALAELGDATGALREADLAAGALTGIELARLLMMRSIVLERLGRAEEALRGYDRALVRVRRAGDRVLEGRVLGNRGLSHVLLGNLSAAEADFLRAEGLLEEGKDEGALAKVRHNLGIVAALYGDAPRALRYFDAVEEQFVKRRLDFDRAILARDRAMVFLSVRLMAEARAAAELAVAELGAAGAVAVQAEALLLLSECQRLDGDLGDAIRVSERAYRVFSAQGRRGWAAAARLAAIRAAWAGGERSEGMLSATRRLRRSVEAAGLRPWAIEASLISARIALELGRTRISASEARHAAEARRARSNTTQARAWHVEALLRLARGDRHGARVAIRAGLRAVERARALLGASDLRAHSAVHGDDLAKLGLRLAVEDGRPEEVLAWTERWRAGGLWRGRARPPDDAALTAGLAELRRLTGLYEDAALEGRDTEELARRRRTLEDGIIRRSRRTAGPGGTPLSNRPPRRKELLQALGEGCLVEVIQHEGQLLAYAAADGHASVCTLGDPRRVAAELHALRFGLRRLATGRGSPASLKAARASVAHSASELDRLLLEPVKDVTEGRPLVAIPTGNLHSLPWSVLPSCRGRPVTVSPSATLWLRAEGLGRQAEGHTVLIAGPDLPGAAREVAALAGRYPSAVRLSGQEATAEATAAALDGAALAHVAAHGSFRVDNPLFSSLRLADGPLTVYDLERLERPPHRLVLSACDSGLSTVKPGDELMGLAATLISLGTSTVIASVGLAPDWATRPLMLDFHRRLRAGATAAHALAAAQASLIADSDDDHPLLAAGGAFVCLGAG